MDEHLYDDLLEEIREESIKVKGVVGTEKCFIRKSGMSFHVDLHLIVGGDITVREGHDIAHRLKNRIRDEMPEIADMLDREPEAELATEQSETEPELADLEVPEDLDDAMAWLEELAVQQGAALEELPSLSDKPEIQPDLPDVETAVEPG